MSLARFIQEHVSFSSMPSYLQRYEPGRTPLSTTPAVITALVTYLAVVLGGREIMRSREPMKLTFLFQLHNILLSLGSFVLLLLIGEEIIPIMYNRGLFHSICGYDAWTPKLEVYYMINYYIKYVELIDTVFLFLKKKPLAFLHVFHHSATALLCFTQLNGRTTVSWVPIQLNLTVHVFMYYYYFATAGGRKIWWKKYLTTMQIIQFVIDLFVIYFATYNYFASTYSSLPVMGTCSGSPTAAIFGCGLLTSYLFLFISFYKTTYRSRGGQSKKPTVGHANGKAINGKPQ